MYRALFFCGYIDGFFARERVLFGAVFILFKKEFPSFVPNFSLGHT